VNFETISGCVLKVKICGFPVSYEKVQLLRIMNSLLEEFVKSISNIPGETLSLKMQLEAVKGYFIRIGLALNFDSLISSPLNLAGEMVLSENMP
jgi:hypothetical protein